MIKSRFNDPYSREAFAIDMYHHEWNASACLEIFVEIITEANLGRVDLERILNV
jgi:hypothetical protein